MKKLFYLLFLLPLAFFASCNDDNDIAQVDFQVTLSGVTQSNNNFYTILDNTVTIDGVSVKSLTDKAATVTGVRYYLDGYPIWASVEDNNFTFDFQTDNLKTGEHVLGITATVLQVDKTITQTVINIPLFVVENEEALPEGAPEIGTYSTLLTMNPQK